MRYLYILVILVIASLVYPSNVSAVVYSGSYPNGLTVSQDGAIVENADISDVNGSGVCLIITGDNVTVRNSKIHNCQDHGVIFKGTNGGLIENSEIYRAAMRDVPNSVGNGWPSLLKVQSIDETTTGLSQNITIKNNYIHDGYGECMGLRGSNITVTGNHVKDCYSIGIYSNSDHTTVEKNFVQCTNNPEFLRSGEPMVGIGFAEETFANWGAHGHDSQTVRNNIIVGCKYGVRYGSSTNGKGLSDTTIAFNTINRTTNLPISISYYSSQSNVFIENNIASSVSVNSSGSTVIGNVPYTFTQFAVPTDFALSGPLPASGSITVNDDFTGKARQAPLDAGAMEYGGTTHNIADLEPDGDVDGNDFNTLVSNFSLTGILGWIRSDILKNGVVDIFDFNKLITNFGQ